MEDFKVVELHPQLANICFYQIRLTGGEELGYYICEKSSRSECITESHAVRLSDELDGWNNQAAALYRLEELQRLGLGDEFALQMDQALQKQILCDRLFHVF